MRICKNLLCCVKALDPPKLKPRVLELTNAGPGIGISNHETRFQAAEHVHIHNLDWLIRICRVTDDPCEAERSNAAAGDAIADGALPVPRMESLNKEQKEYIYMILLVLMDICPPSLQTDPVQPSFIAENRITSIWKLQSLQTKTIPGHGYFDKIHKFYSNHFEKGDLYQRYLKQSCGDS